MNHLLPRPWRIVLTMALTLSLGLLPESACSGDNAGSADGVAEDATSPLDGAAGEDGDGSPLSAPDGDTASGPEVASPEPDGGERLPPGDGSADSVDVLEVSDPGPPAEIDQGADETGPDGAQSIMEQCFPSAGNQDLSGPSYDPFKPVLGSHCFGTNHQDIVGIEEVVFLGDSVTLGTPNDEHPAFFQNEHFYRNLLAEWLAAHFDLDKGGLLDWGTWKSYSALYEGVPGKKTSGDFRNCSKWGARTDDLLEGNAQIPDCFPAGGHDEPTLVIFTMGGNDVAKITQKGAEADPDEVAADYPEAWGIAQSSVEHLDTSLAWLKDPDRFPEGSHVVFANPFEFTDGTGQVDSCSPKSISIAGFGDLDVSALGLNVAELGGFGEWEKPEILAEIVVWMLEQFTALAVKHDADVVWLLEHFCGHGFVATGDDADPEAGCYIGPDAELYFDVSCIHPSEAGHEAIYQMFKAVVLE